MIGFILKIIRLISLTSSLVKVWGFIRKLKKFKKLKNLNPLNMKLKTFLIILIVLYLAGIHVGLYYAYQKYKGCIIDNAKYEDKYNLLRLELDKCMNALKEKDKFIDKLKREHRKELTKVQNQYKNLIERSEKELRLCYSYLDEFMNTPDGKSDKNLGNEKENINPPYNDPVLIKLNRLFR